MVITIETFKPNPPTDSGQTRGRTSRCFTYSIPPTACKSLGTTCFPLKKRVPKARFAAWSTTLSGPRRQAELTYQRPFHAAFQICTQGRTDKPFGLFSLWRFEQDPVGLIAEQSPKCEGRPDPEIRTACQNTLGVPTFTREVRDTPVRSTLAGMLSGCPPP